MKPNSNKIGRFLSPKEKIDALDFARKYAKYVAAYDELHSVRLNLEQRGQNLPFHERKDRKSFPKLLRDSQNLFQD